MLSRELFPNSVILRDFDSPYVQPIHISYLQYKLWNAQSADSLRLTFSGRKLRRRHISILDIVTFYWRIQKMRKIDFVTIRLSNTDKDDFNKYMDKILDDYETHLYDLVGQGYKFSVSYDPTAKCYISAVTGTEEALDNKNKCFTSRSENGHEAVILSLYKHYVLANSGSWDKIETVTSNWG